MIGYPRPAAATPRRLVQADDRTRAGREAFLVGSFLVGVLGNIVANIAFWGLLGGVFWGLGKGAQARFLRFLSLGETSRITVMVSNLWQPGHSRRKIGFTISKHELLAAQAVSSFVGKAPGRLPDIVRGLVDQLWLRSRVQCAIDVSPPDLDQPEPSDCLVVIGGAARNSYRRHFLDEGLTAALLESEAQPTPHIRSDDVRRVIINRANGDRQLVQSELNLAIVEKAMIPGRRAAVFFCHGARADGTWIATEYLLRHWRGLEREFGNGPFVVCLGFPRNDQFFEEYVEPSVLARVVP